MLFTKGKRINSAISKHSQKINSSRRNYGKIKRVIYDAQIDANDKFIARNIANSIAHITNRETMESRIKLLELQIQIEHMHH